MKNKRAYKFRLYPTPQQTRLLQQHGGNARFLWNNLLKQNQDKYEAEKKFIFAYDMINSIPSLKQEHTFLQDSFSQSLQQVAKHLDRAIKDSYRKPNDPAKKEFPVFKKKHHQSDSFTVPQKFRIAKNYVFIPKIGEVEWVKHREIKGKVKHIAISQDGEQWHCSVNVELKRKQQPKLKAQPSEKINIIGVDVGVKTYITLSNEEEIANPKFIQKHEKKLKRIQRSHSRKKLGSKNRRKSKKRLQNQHRKIRNSRNDFQHKLTHSMITKYMGFVLEDLNIQGMMKNHTLAKAVQDCAWYEFKRQIKYKSEWHGKFYHEAEMFDATSKKCCCCGWKNCELTLKDRTFLCKECDLEIGRDVNAAVNLCKIGLLWFLGIKKLPWDTRKAFDLFLERVEQTPAFYYNKVG